MWNNYIGLIGYIFLTIAYSLYLIKHKDSIYFLLGCLLIISGYLTSAVEKTIKIAQNKKKIHKYNFGHIVLFIFYLLTFLTEKKINNHAKDSDVLALLGHAVLIFKNDLNIVGYSSLLVYYILYIIRNFKEFDHWSNKFQVGGGIILIVYYIIEIILKFANPEPNKPDKLDDSDKPKQD